LIRYMRLPRKEWVLKSKPREIEDEYSRGKFEDGEKWCRIDA